MPYNPNLYNPYGPWTQNVQGPTIQNLVSVAGMEGARTYPLPPNSSMALFDADEDIMYVKTTDGAGFPTIKTYRFEEVTEQNDYVSRAEFEELNRKIDELRGTNGKQFVSKEKRTEQPAES